MKVLLKVYLKMQLEYEKLLHNGKLIGGLEWLYCFNGRHSSNALQGDWLFCFF